MRFVLEPRSTVRNLYLALNKCRSDRKHIFVVGAPKSGTTLMQMLLISHKDVTGPTEETFFFLRRRLNTLTSSEVPALELKKYFQESSSKVEMFDRFADFFLKRDNKTVFVEKTPEHALVVRELLELYPLAKLVFLYRDGRDAFISALNHGVVRQKRELTYPYLWRDIIRRMVAIQDNKRVITVRYEELCNDPEPQLQRILDFCELEFYSDLLDPNLYGKYEIAKTAPFARLKERISPKSVGRWRDPANAEHVGYFTSIAQSELNLLGYW